MSGAMYHVRDEQLSEILEETKQSERTSIRRHDNIKINARK
jgi:hypothetical protein